MVARKQLRVKLDNLTWGDQSMEALKRATLKRKGQSAQKKRNRKYRNVEESLDSPVSLSDSLDDGSATIEEDETVLSDGGSKDTGKDQLK